MPDTTTLTAQSVRAERDALVITLPGREIRVKWQDCSDRLGSATDLQRASLELSPGGYGIHWPDLDEDLSVGGLVRDYG